MKQILTITQVKQALHKLAEQKNRPSYEVCTAKEVKMAFDLSLDHPLIEEVLPLIAVPKVVVEEVVVVKPKRPKHRVSKARLAKKRQYPTTAQLKELVEWLNSYDGSHAALSRLAGCSHSILSHVKLGTRNCTLDIFNKVSEARKQLEGMAA